MAYQFAGRFALVVLGSLLLSACGVCPRDPNQAGFVCGAANVIGGVYEEDTAAMERQAVAAEAEAEELRAANERLQGEIDSLEAEEQELRLRQQEMNAELAAQMERLAELRRERRASQAELAALQERAAALAERQQELANLPAGSIDPEELDRLEQENEDLRRQLDTLFEAVGS